MKCNLVIDTNFILNRNAFALSKEKAVYGDLLRSLHFAVEQYSRLYHFKNIYVISDSKTSWRKTIYADYKGTRKKDETMDWEFIHNTYTQFKDEIKADSRYILLEGDHLEGDDWISFIVKESNKSYESCVIVASDEDINQTLLFSLHPLWINVQIKDVAKHEKVFFPENYTLFMNKLREQKSSLFKLNEAPMFHQMLRELGSRRKIAEVSPQAVIFKKLVSGDSGDNIKSLLVTKTVNTKTGKETVRGIGEAGAEKLYEEYISLYPEPIDFTSKLFAKRVIELVKKYKKDTTTPNSQILEKLFLNLRLVKLDPMFMPENIHDTMIKRLNEINQVKV